MWWENNYLFLRNVYTRQIPFKCISYDKLLENSEQTILQVLQWSIHPQSNDLLPIYMRGKHPNVDNLIESINMEAAVQIISQDLKRHHASDIPDIDFPYADKVTKVFEELYNCFYVGDSKITPSFLQEMNKCQKIIEPYIHKEKECHMKELKKLLEM